MVFHLTIISKKPFLVRKKTLTNNEIAHFINVIDAYRQSVEVYNIEDTHLAFSPPLVVQCLLWLGWHPIQTDKPSSLSEDLRAAEDEEKKFIYEHILFSKL